MLSAGFIVAVVFSWIYDITPGGIIRTEPLPKQKLPLINKKVKTYRFTTFVSVIIIIGLLSFNIIDSASARKIEKIDKTIAVLPFTDILPIKYESIVFDYIGNQITAGLSKIDDFNVLPWRSTKNFRKGNKDYVKMGDEMDATILVDWKAIEIEGEKRLTIEMIVAEDEKILWSNDYSIKNSWTEISVISTEISRNIARRLRTFLSLEERARINEIPGSPTALYNAYRGRSIAQNALYLYEMGNRKTDLSDFDVAIDLYTQAIQVDSSFAEAYANRAVTRLWGIYTTHYSGNELEKCLEDIEKAKSIDSNLIEADIAMGFYYYYGKKDFDNALKYFQQALEKDPANVDCLFYLSLVHRRKGNWDEVAELSSQALENDPASALFYINIGTSYDYLHDFEKAIECHNLAIAILPEWPA